MINSSKKTLIIALILVLIALISVFALSKAFADPNNTFKRTMNELDEKKNTVAKMSAISIAAASAIELIPGEAGNSISKELVDLGGYFVLLFAAIYLEKILMSMGGLIAFKVLIPIGLLLIAGFLLLRSEGLKTAGIKCISIGLVLFLLVPASVWVSGRVEIVHDVSAQNSIEEISKEAELLEESVPEIESEDEGVISSFIGKAKDSFKKATSFFKEAPSKMKDLLDSMIDEVAYFFVTTCIIPIVVLILLIEILKQILGFKWNTDYLSMAKMPGKLVASAKDSVVKAPGSEE